MASGDLGTHCCCAAGKVTAGRLTAGKALPACKILQQQGGKISNTAAHLIATGDQDFKQAVLGGPVTARARTVELFWYF